MRKRTIGALLMFSTTVFMGFYTYLLFFSSKSLQEVTLKITIYSLVFIFAASLFLIGYGFFKTPTLTPQEVRERIKRANTGKEREEMR